MAPIHSLSLDSDSSDSPSDHSPPKKKVHLTIPPIPIYIIQQKLSETEIERLYSLVDSSEHKDGPNLKITSSIGEAKVVVTALRMRKRLERHVDWGVARRKAIVTPDWIHACIEQGTFTPCGPFAAIQELHDETVDNCPCRDCESKAIPSPPKVEVAEVPVYDWHDYDYASAYVCTRASPLVCPNQELARQLTVISRDRGLEQKEISALSYARACAVIKAFPQEITRKNLEEVLRLPFIGEKTGSKVSEFVEKGSISEAMKIETTERCTSLNAFSQIHGIGPSKARDLYSDGFRTLEDLAKFYYYTASPQNNMPVETMTLNDLPTLSTSAALHLHQDLEQRIPRSEVEQIHGCIQDELNHILKGVETVVCGGYRRGKPYSNDVDIVIGHPEFFTSWERQQELARQFLVVLYGKGIVTHIFRQSVKFHNKTPKHQRTWTPPHALDVILTIFKLPHSNVHRQVDFIFVLDPKAYWTAVLGWTGSKMFQRDIRKWAKDMKGLKFDSTGLTRRHDSHVFYPRSEKEIFDILGLKWIHPTLRNADF